MGEAIISRPLPSVIKHDVEFQDGYITFNNTNEYYALKKIRSINNILNMITVGVGSDGRSVLEHYTDESLDGRIEFDTNGIFFSKSSSDTKKKVLLEGDSSGAKVVYGTYSETGSTTTLNFSGTPRLVVIALDSDYRTPVVCVYGMTSIGSGQARYSNDEWRTMWTTLSWTNTSMTTNLSDSGVTYSYIAIIE